jgi:hypothetical protein
MSKTSTLIATPAPSLEERIGMIRSEIETVIETHAVAVAKESPGVPLGVIRNLLTARAPACPCTQYLGLNAKA